MEGKNNSIYNPQAQKKYSSPANPQISAKESQWRDLEDEVTDQMKSLDKQLALSYKSNRKAKKVFVFFICFACLFIIFGLIIIGVQGGEPDPEYLSLPVLGIINLIIFIPILHSTNKTIRKYKEKKAQLVENEKKFRQSVVSGNYAFPFSDFYAQCVANGFSDISSAYHMEKARLLADEILKQKGVPSAYFPLYDSDEKLKSYLDAGQKERMEAEIQIQREEEEAAGVPHKAVLTNTEQDAFKTQNKAAELTGRDKRKFLLDTEISSCYRVIFRIREKQDAAFKLGTMISQSAAKERTTDWSIAGGIASGIAGPAAGIAVAADTMRKNAAIEARNQERQNDANALAAQVFTTAWSSTGSTSEWYKKIDQLNSELEKLPTKVVLNNYDRSTLQQAIKIEDYSVNSCESNALNITINISNSLLSLPDTPEGVQFTIDGSFLGNIYAGNLFVGTVNIPFPTFGIPCGEKKTIAVYSEMFSKNGQKYRIEFQPKNLWVMEI